MNSRVCITAFALAFLLAGSTLSAQDKERSAPEASGKSRGDRHGWLGVSVRDVTPRLARERNLSVTRGALIVDVSEESPAGKAGLKEGDVIVGFNSTAIVDAGDLTDAVRAAAPESQADVDVRRGEEKTSVKVTLGKAPRHSFSFSMPPIPHIPPMHALPRIPRIHVFTSHDVLGLSLNDLNKQLGEYFEAPNGKGVLVEEVERGSAGEKSGFKAGDVIVKIGAETIEDTRDVLDALDDARKGETVTIGILRKGSQKNLTVQADDITRSRSFRMRSEDLDDDDAGGLGIHREEFRSQMEHLKDQLRSLGRHIREHMKHLRQTLRRELHHVMS